VVSLQETLGARRRASYAQEVLSAAMREIESLGVV
jgi:hypothetical protein